MELITRFLGGFISVRDISVLLSSAVEKRKTRPHISQQRRCDAVDVHGATPRETPGERSRWDRRHAERPREPGSHTREPGRRARSRHAYVKTRGGPVNVYTTRRCRSNESNDDASDDISKYTSNVHE